MSTDSGRKSVTSLIPLFEAAFLAFLYMRTLAPDLTWAHDGADGGDLVTAAAVGGVPHPTGYPTYMLVASAFLRLPVGSLGFRTNLMSATCTIAAALIIHAIVVSTGRGAMAAVVAALAFGTFPLTWSQAIITEVNALHALFVALVLYLLVVAAPNPFVDLLGGLALGLGAGNHTTTLIMLPFLFVRGIGAANAETTIPPLGEKTRNWLARIARRVLGLCMGLTVYALLPLRAQTNPPVNWGAAVDWRGLLWLATGQMYWGRLRNFDLDYLYAGARAWSNLLMLQLGVVGLLLIVVALAVLLRRSRLFLATGWLIAAQSVFAVLYYSPDSYVYLLPALIGLAIWMGLAAAWIYARVSPRSPLVARLVAVGIPAFILVRAAIAIPEMDLSKDNVPRTFAETILEAAPPDAILVTEGDESTFALWYFHYAYRERSDVAVVCSDLLAYAWYRSVLATTYPDLVLPVPASVQALSDANPRRASCRVPSGLPARLECRASATMTAES